MSTHTPGPWHVEPVSYPERAHPEVYAGEKRIAKPCNSPAVPAPESDANVRLIAAAPDLLVAARLALHKIEQTLAGQYSRGQALEATLGPLRAAIAKAKGD
jgi:hypothetical protein